MNKMWTVKDLIREVKLKAYYASLSPEFISSNKVSATLEVRPEFRVIEKTMKQNKSPG